MIVINGVEYSSAALAGMIDYAILDPDTTESVVREACKTGIQYKFKGVHPNPYWVALVADLLEGTGIETGAVLSFPFGANPTSFKVHEAKAMVKVLKGRPACIDVVTNIGRLKSKDYAFYTDDIAAVVAVGHDAGLEVKSILEVALLTDDEVKAACECAVKAGVQLRQVLYRTRWQSCNQARENHAPDSTPECRSEVFRVRLLQPSAVDHHGDRCWSHAPWHQKRTANHKRNRKVF